MSKYIRDPAPSTVELDSIRPNAKCQPRIGKFPVRLIDDPKTCIVHGPSTKIHGCQAWILQLSRRLPSSYATFFHVLVSFSMFSLPEIAFQAYKQPKMFETNLLLLDAFKKSKLTLPEQIVGQQIGHCFFLDDASS